MGSYVWLTHARANCNVSCQQIGSVRHPCTVVPYMQIPNSFTSAESMRYNPPSWYGVDTSRILREDGVDVYGGGRLNSSGGGSEEEAAEGEAVGLDVDAPFTMAGLRNDADVPLVAMVDGMPVKVPPHFILEMKPTGRALTLWA